MSDQPIKPSGLGEISPKLLCDIQQMIEEARAAVAVTVNAGLTMLYWRIGGRVGQEILKGSRAEYGEEIVSTVSRQLEMEYGSGFSAKNIRHMIRFADVFPDVQIVSTMSRQLSWSHFKEIIYLKEPLQKEFYAEMCRVERWSVRTLRQKIASMLYERTALSKKPAELAKLELQALREEDKMTPDLVFRDPYLLDFLGLKGAYQEKDLEAAILRELESFILELGGGWWRWNSSSTGSGPITRARWSYICAGLRNTSANRGKIRPWALSSAPGKTPNRSNFWSSAARASTSPNT